MPYGDIIVDLPLSLEVDLHRAVNDTWQQMAAYPNGTYRETFETQAITPAYQDLSLDIQTIKSTNGSDRNAPLIAAFKALPRTYELKFVNAKFGIKERYYNDIQKKMRTRRVPGKVASWIPVKRNLKKFLEANRLANEFEVRIVQWFQAAHVVYSTWNYRIPASSTPSQEEIVRKLIATGSVLAFDASLFVHDAFGSTAQVIDWRTPVDPPHVLKIGRGWPAWHVTTKEALFSKNESRINSIHATCLEKLYPRVKKANLDLATALAEISQAALLIKGLAIRIGEAFLLLKKGRIAAAMSKVIPQSKKELANANLAYRYGVSPLMSDTEAAGQHIAELVIGFKPRRVRAVHSQSFEDIITEGNFKFTFTTDVTVKYTILFGLDELWKNQLSRLGFTSPANVTWELTPFSFVLDWFLPIGKYLSTLSAFEGLFVYDKIVKTIVVDEVIKCDCHVPGDDGVTYWNWVPEVDTDFVWEFRQKFISRTLLSLEDMPDLPKPSFRNPFSVLRLTNALSLLQQMFGGKG